MATKHSKKTHLSKKSHSKKKSTGSKKAGMEYCIQCGKNVMIDMSKTVTKTLTVRGGKRTQKIYQGKAPCSHKIYRFVKSA